jgi:tetratricopeptide (TPR) repeat protein
MEWVDFLESIAIKHKLTDEQRDTLRKLFAGRNDKKSNIQISNELNISEAGLKKRLGAIYKIFESTCPEVASSQSRGKVEALRACLWQQYERRNSPSPQVVPVTTPSNLPLSGVVKFVGRDEELVAVHEKLQEAATVAISSVSGMSGVGKTELALQYAYSKLREEAYPGGICWIQASVQDVGIGILEFARNQLGLPQPPELLNTVPQQVKWVCDRWQGKPILLVLDDVVDYDAVQPYLQQLDARFRVLMTTRWKLGTPGKRLELEVLTEGAALELLRVLVDDAERINSQLADAQQLCEWLGYLPLGLELVGRYLARKQDLSLLEMLGRLQAKRLEAKALVKAKEMTAQLGVAAAFELSWVELPEAARVLSGLLSLFALAPIPWKLVEQCLPEEDEEELEDCRDEELLGRSLLSRVGQGRYQLHPLIREFFAVKLERELGDIAKGLQQRFALVLTEVAKTIPQTVTLDVIARVEEALPHLAVVAEELTHLVEDEDAKWSFIELARMAQAQSRWQEAEHWLTTCLQMTRTRFGDNHPDVATSLNNLAALYYAQGQYEQAEPLYLQALELKKRLLGDNRSDVATTLNNLAGLYKSQGRYEQAEPLYLKALELKKCLLGDNHPDVATTLNNLAGLYYAQRRYKEAKPLFLQALELRKSLLGDNHPHVATSLNNLAGLYSAQGWYEQAEPLFLQALELYKRLLGDNHPDVATTLNNLAGLYSSQKCYKEAEPLFLQALELDKRLLGDNHPHVAMSLNNLAGLYESQGQYKQAELLFLQALELYKRLLGDNHPDVATSLHNLAGLYESQGRYEQAEPLYLRTLEIRVNCLGENHPDTQTALNNFWYLIQQAVQNGKAGELSAHPLTQRILQEVRAGE